MGITIHYSGKIKDTSRISSLISEVADVCETMTWKYSISEKEIRKHYSGISFTVPECETVHLEFDHEGRLINSFFIDSFLKEGKHGDIVFCLFCKTQYGGPDSHKVIVKFLKYLSSKYEINLEVMDETDFWNTQNEELMRAKFEEMNDIIDGFFRSINGEQNEYSAMAKLFFSELEKWNKRI